MVILCMGSPVMASGYLRPRHNGFYRVRRLEHTSEFPPLSSPSPTSLLSSGQGRNVVGPGRQTRQIRRSHLLKAPGTAAGYMRHQSSALKSPPSPASPEHGRAHRNVTSAPAPVRRRQLPNPRAFPCSPLAVVPVCSRPQEFHALPLVLGGKPLEEAVKECQLGHKRRSLSRGVYMP